MKIIINYDLIDKIKDINEAYGIFKIIRNNRQELAIYIIPTCLPIDIIIAHESSKTALVLVMFQILTYLAIELTEYIDLGDYYKKLAIKDLKRLVSLLKSNDIDTDFDLLKESMVYAKKYKLKINRDNLIEILESKYILIPTYDFNGHIKKTSFLQEHVIGSHEYVLSLGKFEKKHDLIPLRCNY